MRGTAANKGRARRSLRIVGCSRHEKGEASISMPPH
jgi:hypothetical protein